MRLKSLLGSGRAAVCLQVGKGNARLGVERRDVCITSTQRRRLRPGRVIGCGSFACAYARPDGAVVKLTQDDSDVAALQKARGVPGVVRVLRAWRLVPQGVAAVVTDRVAPLPGRAAGVLLRLAAIPWGALYDDSDAAGTFAYRLSPEWMSFVLRHACKGALDRRECAAWATQVVELHERLGRIGIRWHDVHPHQAGLGSDGRLVVFDLGLSRSGVPALPALAGARTRGHRCRSRS